MARKKLLVVSLLILAFLALFFLVRSRNTKKLPQITVSESKSGELVADFPEFPVYADAKVANSYSGNQNGKKVYGAAWEIQGSDLDKVVDWYEDDNDALPSSWVFEEPLQKDNEENPTSEWLKVSKNGWEVLVTMQQVDPEQPVVVSIQATEK